METSEGTRPDRPGGKQRLETTDREDTVREARPLRLYRTTPVSKHQTFRGKIQKKKKINNTQDR